MSQQWAAGPGAGGDLPRPRDPSPSATQTLDSWLQRHRTSVDLLTGIASFVLLGILTVVAGPSYPGGAWAAATVWLAAIGMSAAIAVRGRFPVASAAAINALALLHWTAGAGLLPVDALIYVSVYSATVHAPVWARRVSLGSALLGSALVAIDGIGLAGSGLTDRVISTVFVFIGVSAPAVIAWALGLLRRNLRQRWETLTERAARLELERDQQAAIAAGSERARIAREMHDVVAHSLSVIVAQADGGRYAARSDPQTAVTSLETIASTARSALADTRRILGVLRGDGDADTAPQPGLGSLDDLVSQVRSSGLAIEVHRWGTPQPLSAAADLTVYRVCQESITNVLKHGGQTSLLRTRLDIAWHPWVLVVQIDDDGRGAASASDGAGHGLLGMRERVALFGGTLEAGPRPGGGFRVKATLPLAAIVAGSR